MEQRKLQDQAHALVDFTKMQVKFSDVLGEVREDQKINSDETSIRIDSLENRMKNIENLLEKIVEQNEKRVEKNLSDSKPKENNHQIINLVNKTPEYFECVNNYEAKTSQTSIIRRRNVSRSISGSPFTKSSISHSIEEESTSTLKPVQITHYPSLSLNNFYIIFENIVYLVLFESNIPKEQSPNGTSFGTPDSLSNFMTPQSDRNSSIELVTRNSTLLSSDDHEFNSKSSLQAIDYTCDSSDINRSAPTETFQCTAVAETCFFFFSNKKIESFALLKIYTHFLAVFHHNLGFKTVRAMNF